MMNMRLMSCISLTVRAYFLDTVSSRDYSSDHSSDRLCLHGVKELSLMYDTHHDVTVPQVNSVNAHH